MMSQGNSPSDEKRRLESLCQYRVLDTLPEQALDELTALAAQVCEAPISLISLVDEHRQWFKSRVGLEAEETPREFSFCTHALRQTELLIVPDATQDARFAANPLVTGEPGIRFYAGAPLVTMEGEGLGTLCVLDRVPRTLTPVQEQVLRVLGRQVMTHFELRRQALKLAESERLLRAIFDAEPECVKLLSADGKVQMMNRAGLAIIEADSFEEIAGQSVFPLIADEDQPFFEALTERIFRGESGTLKFQIVGLKGTPRWLETHAAPLRNEAGVVTALLAITRDVSDRHRGEAALRERGELLQAIFDHIPVMLCFMDRVGRMQWVNREAERVFGWTLADIQAHEDIFAEWYPDAEYRAGVRKFISEATGKFREFRSRTRSGMVPTNWASVRLADGTNVGIGLDITEQKRSEDRFRRLVDSNAQGVLFWKTGGAIAEANDAFLSIVGYSREDLEAGRLNWIAMTPPELAGRDQRCLEEIAARGVCTPYEKEYFRKDGSRVPILLGAASFENDPEDGVAFAVELTERKKLERQYLRAQRLESIGTLASGVAHDLNNILSPIMMSVPMLRRDLRPEQRESIISTIEMSAERGARIVKQVLTFGRGLEGDKCPLNVGPLIEELMEIMRGTFPKGLAIESASAPDLWPVLGDSTQLHQVLLNLCVNARDAMPKGGRLRLQAANLDLDASYASMLPEAAPGPHLLIEVSDTGTGIPPEIVDHIFDPFFTTKSLGNGTGLGLSTVLGIVKSHGGFIQVNTQPGAGTTFQVYLPAAPGRHAAPPDAARARIPAAHGELVLLVDDEVSVRDAARLVLETAGYTVLPACDGTEALALFAMNSGLVSAVLTDLMMPFMDGVAWIRALRTIAPGLPIVASTGLREKVRLAELKAMNVETVLHKPYTADTLLRALHGALHPAASSPSE